MSHYHQDALVLTIYFNRMKTRVIYVTFVLMPVHLKRCYRSVKKKPHANRLSDRLETVIEIKRKMRKERMGNGHGADKIAHAQTTKPQAGPNDALSTVTKECLHCVNMKLLISY
jgi:methionine aminopeptidase